MYLGAPNIDDYIPSEYLINIADYSDMQVNNLRECDAFM